MEMRPLVASISGLVGSAMLGLCVTASWADDSSRQGQSSHTVVAQAMGPAPNGTSSPPPAPEPASDGKA